MYTLLFTYLFWPAGAFLLSLRRVRGKEFAVLFVMMAMFMGLNVYTVPTGTWLGGDLVSFLDDAVNSRKLSWRTVFSQNDYYLDIMGKLITPISSNRTFLATVFYMVYGLLFIQSFKIVVKNFTFQKNNYTQYLFLSALFLVYPFTFFNALRFATATVFFLWVLLEVFINKKKVFWILFLIPPLIHYAYWVALFIPFLWLFLRNRLLIAFVLFIVSYSLSSVQTSYAIFNFTQRNMDENISNTLSGYAAEDSRDIIDERYENLKLAGNFNRTVFTNSLAIRNNTMMILLGLITVMGYRRIKNTKKLKHTITLMLVTASVANIAASISNGDRFYHTMCLINVFLLFYVIYTLVPENEKIKKFYTKKKLWICTMFLISVFYGLIHIYSIRDAYNMFNVLFGNVFLSFLW